MGTKLKPGEFDCYHEAELDEPMFVLLARDVDDAAWLTRRWARRRWWRQIFWPRLFRLMRGDHFETAEERRELAKIAEARACADAMETWADARVWLSDALGRKLRRKLHA